MSFAVLFLVQKSHTKKQERRGGAWMEIILQSLHFLLNSELLCLSSSMHVLQFLSMKLIGICRSDPKHKLEIGTGRK